MDRRWENSDASYDARNSISDKRSYQDHCDDLEDKSIVHLDNDYLNFHRLLTGQPAKHRPRNESICVWRHYSVKKRIDLMFGEDDETPDKSDRGSEIDPDYALLCDATFEMQEKSCTVQVSVETGKEHTKGREKGSLFHENDNVKNDDGTQKEVASEKEFSAAAEQMETGNTIQTDNLAEVQKPKGKAPAKKKKGPAKKKNAAGEDDDPKMENSNENDAVHGLLCLRNVA